LEKAVATCQFWNLPTGIKDFGGLDGSEWIVEIISKGKYHMVKRWSPSDSTLAGFSQIGKFLIDISPITEEKKDVY
jgi:hypothetical protein